MVTGDELDPDTAFDLLSNRRRRLVLCLLTRRESEVHLRDLAADVVSTMEGVEPDDVSESDYRSVYVSLYQNHVPRLAEAGVVDYDADERSVVIVDTPNTHRLLGLVGIEAETPDDRPVLLVVLAASLAAVATTTGALPSVYGRWGLPLAVLLVGGAVALGHTVVRRRRFGVVDCGEIETTARWS